MSKKELQRQHNELRDAYIDRVVSRVAKNKKVSKRQVNRIVKAAYGGLVQDLNSGIYNYATVEGLINMRLRGYYMAKKADDSVYFRQRWEDFLKHIGYWKKKQSDREKHFRSLRKKQNKNSDNSNNTIILTEADDAIELKNKD